MELHIGITVIFLSLILTSEGIDGPRFSVIEVGVSSIDWEVSVGQSTPRAVKGVSIPMFALLKPNFNVNLA